LKNTREVEWPCAFSGAPAKSSKCQNHTLLAHGVQVAVTKKPYRTASCSLRLTCTYNRYLCKVHAILWQLNVLKVLIKTDLSRHSGLQDDTRAITGFLLAKMLRRH
jgi:hypothetical protein